MKTHPKLRMSVALLISLLLAGTGTVAAQSAPAAPPAGGTFEQRLAQRKQERNIQLNDKDQKRLTQQCISAQGVVRGLQQSSGPIIANRTKTFQRVDAKLWVIIGRLKLADKDTFELEKRRVVLAEKTANFQSLAANYQQTLDDIVVINCQADVAGFKALIDTARLYNTQLRDVSKDIRKYVVDDIKPILSGHVTELQPKSAEGNN